MEDLISREAAIKAVHERAGVDGFIDLPQEYVTDAIRALPSVQPTLYGYSIEHLAMIARILQRENVPPDRVVETLTDIERTVAFVRDEFQETLRKAVEQCMT